MNNRHSINGDELFENLILSGNMAKGPKQIIFHLNNPRHDPMT